MEEFTKGMPTVRALLQTDIEAAFGSDPSALSREGNHTLICIEAISIQRLAHRLHLAGHQSFPV
jgi:hypothetical protein